MQPSVAKPDATVLEFRDVLYRLCHMLNDAGMSARAHDGVLPKHFAALPSARQMGVLENTRRYTDVAEAMIRVGEVPAQSQQFLWRMFQRLGVRPVSNLMDHLEANDVVEIYNADFVQVFRSFSFFSICSYTLDDLLCRPFWELFRRDEELFGRMVEKTKLALAGDISGVHYWDVDIHSVDEIESPARYHAEVRYKLLSPLHDASGGVPAFVNVFTPLSCVSTFVPPPAEQQEMQL